MWDCCGPEAPLPFLYDWLSIKITCLQWCCLVKTTLTVIGYFAVSCWHMVFIVSVKESCHWRIFLVYTVALLQVHFFSGHDLLSIFHRNQTSTVIDLCCIAFEIVPVSYLLGTGIAGWCSVCCWHMCRCKKVIMPVFGVGSKLTRLDSIANVTGAHLDVEKHDEKIVIIIK